MYKIDAQGKIIRIDGAEIPRDVTNPAYQQFIHWQQFGPHPYADQVQEPEPVPVEEEKTKKLPTFTEMLKK